MADCIVVSDTAANDSDKALTIPDGAWKVESIRIEYTATASAGNRTLEVRYKDKSGDVVWATEITTDFVASDVMVVNLSPGATTVTPVDQGDEGAQHCAAGIPSGGSIQVIDTAAVAATADDMVLHAVLRSV